MKIVEICIEHSVMKLDQSFTYLSDDDNIAVGKRVLIDFNRQKIIGFVVDCQDTNNTYEQLEQKYGFKLKYINQIIDDEVILNEELLELAKFMAKDTISPLISCLNTILPPKLKPKKQQAKISYVNWVRKVSSNEKITEKQKMALDTLAEPMEYSEFRTMFSGLVTTLKNKGLIEVYQIEKTADKTNNVIMSKDKQLTPIQRNALDQLKANNSIALLHGVTGSGKTEVYLQLAKEFVEMGQQVLFLVPEIALTPQMVQRVKERFLDNVAIYHSGLNANEKYMQYQLVKNQEVAVVVGTRSSVFMPFCKLGLIIIDEEHDGSYKQDNVPCYHVRDIAIKRCEYFKCKLVLGSATPSLESYARAMKGVYDIVKMDKRINDQLPNIKVIDLNEVVKNRGDHIITQGLQEAIATRLHLQQQVIILLNRRGFHPLMKCSSCNEPIKCDYCDVAMNYHHDDNSLKCHMCNRTKSTDYKCSKCGASKFANFGFGTQKVEAHLKTLFPSARIQRMDADTTRFKNSHEIILKSFGEKEIDILVGTQMIAKGLDFEDVTLVAILNADQGLSRLDFRAAETTFDLIMQAAGRSGRHQQLGEVYLQVYNPLHYAVSATERHDYDYFFTREMNYRHCMMYPPYSYLIAIYVSDLNVDLCVAAIDYLKKNIIDNDLDCLEPTELIKINGFSRYRIIIKGNNLSNLKEKVYLVVKNYYNEGYRVRIKVDVNPLFLG